MKYFIIGLLGILVIAALVFLKLFKSRKPPKKGFDKNGNHSNGTRFDDEGYDYKGFDREGFNRQGYNTAGKNRKGQYNRYFDIADFQNDVYSPDGFLDPAQHPVAVTNHARQRMQERMGIHSAAEIDRLALDAYQFGRSARQLKKTSAAEIQDIQERHGDGIVLIYRNYIYIFTCENVLKTVYKNDHISL